MAGIYSLSSGRGINGTNQSIPVKRPKIIESGKITVVLGTQWGDEGKGKVVDLLCDSADVVCRCQVGLRFGASLRS